MSNITKGQTKHALCTHLVLSSEVRKLPMAASGSNATPGKLLIQDLENIQSFLGTQKRVVKQEQFTKMLDNQVKAWVTRINEMNIKPEEAARVGELLSEGPWLDQHHEVLSEALASKMDGAAAGNQARARRPLHTLTCFAAYLTESDCQILSDPDVHNVNKVQRLVAKCVKLGLHLPRETTNDHHQADHQDRDRLRLGCVATCIKCLWRRDSSPFNFFVDLPVCIG